jgi:large subunit ribosomal protein L22
VLKQIQGKTYLEAHTILGFMPYEPCSPVLKVLNSAFANAKRKFNFNEVNCKVLSAFADRAKPLKRSKTRAKGGSSVILKRTTHITIYLEV